MKGLWLKDWLLLKKQLKILLIFILIAVFNGYNSGFAFLAFFMGFFFVSLATTTVSYDQNEHGITYLKTLPIKWQSYAQQKVSLVLVMALVASLFSGMSMIFISWIAPEKSENGLLMFVVASLMISFLFGTILLALYLKYGAEQGRLFLFVLMGVILISVYLISKLPQKQMTQLIHFFSTLAQASTLQLLLSTIGIIAFVYFVAYQVSYRCLVHSKVS